MQVLPSSTSSDYTGEVLALFGDLRQSTIFGSRRGFEMVVDESRYVEYRQILFQVTERIDIVSHGTGSASTCGPVAALYGNS